MKKNRKIIFNLIFFIVLIILTFSILLKDQNILEIFTLMLDANKAYILIAIVCMMLYLALEGVNLKRTLDISSNQKIKFRSAFKYALIGFFFSAITPAASGGQPMQILYMHRDKLPVSSSTLALLMNLCSFQVITISMALVSLIFYRSYLDGVMTAMFIIGILLNSTALALLLIGIFSERLPKWFAKVTVKLLRKLKVKNIEQKEEKIMNELTKYHGSSKYIKEHKKIIYKILITTLVQIIIYNTIPYWVYRSLGFNEASIIQMIALQSILYATVSGIPLPGAVGVSESGFLSIFKTIFINGTISGAMLINRGISFYLYVIISGIVVIVNLFKTKKEDNMTKEDNQP